MACCESSLSAGLLLRAALLCCEPVARVVTRIFPVYTAEAGLPYIYYRRKALEGTAVKRMPVDDTVAMQLYICAATYDESLAIAEAVRAHIDGRAWDDTQLGMRARMCHLTDAEEYFEADAYVQLLTFNLKISQL